MWKILADNQFPQRVQYEILEMVKNFKDCGLAHRLAVSHVIAGGLLSVAPLRINEISVPLSSASEDIGPNSSRSPPDAVALVAHRHQR